VRCDAQQGQIMASFNQFRGRLIAPQTGAEELDVSEATIHRWIRNGFIRAVKPSSRCTRIDGDSLADFLESRTFAAGRKQEQPGALKRSKQTATIVDLAGQG